MECISYMKTEDIPENKEMFVYGFKHVKTDKIDKYLLVVCESDELNENDKLFNSWSKKFINKEIEIGNFKITAWFFMALVKRNNYFKIQGICMYLKTSTNRNQTVSFLIISIYY